MRISEIIGDSWEQRHATHQAKQVKQQKITTKIASAKDSAARQRRTAADRQAAANDKIRDLQRDLAQPE